MRKQNKRHYKRHSRRKYLIIPVLMVLSFLIGALGGVIAKYVQDAGDHKAVVRAKEFYFSSDLLTENGKTYTLNPGTTSITFEIRNYDDQLRHSESNVKYTVSATGNATVLTEGEPLEGNVNSSAIIEISDLVDGQTYTVTATGNSVTDTGNAGYVKTLSATFTVSIQNEGVYKHLQKDSSGAFVLLTVWTENKSGDVTIQFPSGLIPDVTDDNLDGIKNYKGGTYIANTAESGISNDAGYLDVYSSHTYRFFLETPFTDYAADSFTVNVGTMTAIEKNPD